MDWQGTEASRIAVALPDAAVRVHGSATDSDTLDGWSDLDLRMITDRPVPITALSPASGVWAYEDVRTADSEVCRLVLVDGRRIDVSISGAGRIEELRAAPDNDIRFIAALAASRLGRGDQLIGGHLVLELLRACLVVAMQLRDRDLGTTVHRTGGARDHYADQAMELAAAPLTITPRPNIVERAAQLYRTWRAELDADYVSDWSPLSALIDRGLQHHAFVNIVRR